jgi:hypothetical protein
MQGKKPIDIPINVGARPDWQVRLGYPVAYNLFVGVSGYLYSTPGKDKISTNAPDQNARAIHKSKFGGGRIFVVTENSVIYIKDDGTYVNVGTIQNSGQCVEIDENIQNQIGIVDGKKMYVYDQRESGFITLGSDNGFNISSPISICVLNGIAIIFDRISNTWIISSVNNMTQFPVWNFPTLSSQCTQGISVKVMNNNLHILGTTGVERWVPQTSNSPFLFPFAKDNNYFVPYGPIKTCAVAVGKNEILFLSSNYTPTVLNSNGYQDLLKPADGFSRIISQYEDVADCMTSYVLFRDHEFLYMTFPTTGISWVYNRTSQTMHQVDDIVIDSLKDYETIATPEGIFSLSLTPDKKHRRFQSEIIRFQKGSQPNRQLINTFELQLIQGLVQPTPDEVMELTLSLDGQSYTNTVTRPFGKTGERNAVMTWSMNIAAQQAMFRCDYYGSLDLTISKATCYIT